MGVPSVLILPMSQELGWSIGGLPLPQGFRLALFGLAVPLAGGLMLRLIVQTFDRAMRPAGFAWIFAAVRRPQPAAA
jgi:hypothetical protein